MRLLEGTITIAKANTAVQASTTAESILGGVFKARAGNTGNVYLGSSTVTTSSGFELTPGDAMEPNVALIQTGSQHGSIDLSQFWINGATACDKVDFLLAVR